MTPMHRKQRGAAILTAMLTVVLVASLAASALWQQWRGIEVETAERSRSQSSWILTGALDWARLILREDARKGGADHLAEPWAIPLEQARLSTFLAADRSDALAAEETQDAFLSGQMQDLQSRLNVTNLIDNAAKYSAAGTIIRIDVREKMGYFGIAVIDQGSGIPDELKHKVFSEFFRISPESQIRGVGLGLSIVQRIAAAHGGDVELASRVGVGSDFCIWLRTEQMKEQE